MDSIWNNPGRVKYWTMSNRELVEEQTNKLETEEQT